MRRDNNAQHIPLNNNTLPPWNGVSAQYVPGPSPMLTSKWQLHSQPNFSSHRVISPSVLPTLNTARNASFILQISQIGKAKASTKTAHQTALVSNSSALGPPTVCCTACLFTFQLVLVTSYTAWWQEATAVCKTCPYNISTRASQTLGRANVN